MSQPFAMSSIALHPTVARFLANRQQFYIGGSWRDPVNNKSFTTYNPSTGTVLAQVPAGDVADIDLAVQAARKAFEGTWTQTLTPMERSKLIWKLADLIERDAEIFAQIDSLDNGKPYSKALSSDVPLTVDHFRYYAGYPTKIEGATIPVNTFGMLNYTVREPIGVCGLIVPWNYPLLMAAWKIAPALAAGNCIILKPAEQTSLSAIHLATLFEEAGFPPGVFNVVTGLGDETGAALTTHEGVDKIGFTGSSEVARKILRASTGNLKRVSLELGGKSPNIVFADADVSQAITGATWAIFGNNGQSCTAGSRLYIERSIFDAVLEGVADEASRIRVGMGMALDQPQIGPVVSQEQMQTVMGYIEQGRQAGAEIVLGGKRIGGAFSDGYFIEPTIFTSVAETMSIAREEIFGPVVVAMPFDDVSEIVRRANDTPYGLAAGLWTKDLSKAHRVAKALRAGTVWINTWGDTEASSPFGGYKQSGHGREMGKDAIDLYTEVKSVWVHHG